MATSEADKKAEDFAKARIAALLDDSDSDDAPGDWNLGITDIPSSSQENQLKPPSPTNYDIDLEDEDLVIAPARSSSPAKDATEAEDDDGSAAYARLLKTKLAKQKSKSPSPVRRFASPAKAVAAPRTDESSEDDIPVKNAIRRPKRMSASPSPARSASPTLARSSSPQLPQATRPITRSPSPGLFVSPTRPRDASKSPRSAADDGSESDDMPTTMSNAKLQSLIAKKRAEREAKEAAEKEKKQAARKQESEKQKKLAKQYKDIYSSELNDGMTEEDRTALVENSRPTQRKASKKALEEMNRETQRMARNQQLTHQARVKRKFTTADFLKGFQQLDSDDRPKSPGALESSDHEANVPKDTPPSSPPSLKGSHKAFKIAPPLNAVEDEYTIHTGPQVEARLVVEDEELPDLDTIMSSRPEPVNKGKAKAIPSSPPKQKTAPAKGPRKQIRVSVQPNLDDSDDDLVIEPRPKSRFAAFDKLPEKKATESKSIHNLRAFAHMSPPSKNARNGKSQGITQAQLRMRLAQEMHKQTVADKQERIAALRARGIEFKTEEEIEEDQLYVENMLEKAREEAMKLGLKEKKDAEKNGEEIDENYQLPSEDEDEEGDWEEEEEEDEGDEAALSGSEEEDEQGEEEDGPERTGTFDDAAEEADDDEEDDAEAEDAVMEEVAPEIEAEAEEEEEVVVKPQAARSKPRNRNVVFDDDDDEPSAKESAQLLQPPTPAPAARGSTHTSPIADAFGFAMPAGDLSLTQMFKGTMDELATQDNTQATPARQSLDFLRDAQTPALADMSPALPQAGLLVPSSQAMATPVKPQQGMVETPRFTPQFPTPAGVNSQMSPTKLSEIPEPTQDAGFDSFPATRAATQPHSTVETVMIPMPESPVVQKKAKKLRRRAQQVAELSEDEDVAPIEGDDASFELTTNAFDALFKKAKKPPQPDFDRKTSEAKKMFEEQAEESEDEYAGLGGADGEHSDDEANESDKEMLDDGKVDEKAGELAAFYAERDRDANEKGVNRLYQDITTGALRKRKGGNVDDLSDDSDDEAEEIRRRKRLEFAKMRKALMLDENVGKLYENKKKHAFFKAIEDREEDEIDYLGEMEELDASVEASQAEGEQADQQLPQIPGEDPALTQNVANTSAKRKLPDDFSAPTEKRVAPDMSHRRRAADPERDAMFKKSLNTKQSIAELLEDPHSIVPDSQVSESEGEQEDEEHDEEMDDFIVQDMPKRNDGNGSAVLTTVRASVINRLTVSRQNSMQEDEAAPSGPMAFHTSTSNMSGIFKVPSLLRRATTNLSNASNSSSGTTTPTTGNNENAVRMGGSKRSNIHFQAREAERMKKVRDAEVRRKEGIRKSVVGKGRVSVLGKSMGRHSGFE